MEYLKISFDIQPYSEAAADVLAALLGERGCDTFVPREDGLDAYMPNDHRDDPLQDLAQDFPLPGVSLTHTVTIVPDQDWNATWEAEGFEPIRLGDDLLIYNDRHGEPYVEPSATPRRLVLHPRQAFGSGTHQTTRMVLDELLHSDIRGKRVIDAGCGTGILGIAAAMLGASQVTAYDIDAWSVENSRENFGLNAAHHAEVTILHGDSSVLAQVPAADIVMANIHRNIILADMPVFAAHLLPQGSLIISGFLQDDVQALTTRAHTLGLTLSHHVHDGEWQCLTFTLNP